MPFLPIVQDEVMIQALRGPSASQADGSFFYEGEVTVRYGVSKLNADRVTLYRDQGRGVAEGHVLLIDPDGTAKADRIEFKWDVTKGSFLFGSGDNVDIRVSGAFLRAKHATFEPQEWTLLEVEASTCIRPTPVYMVTTEKLIIRPGKQVEVREPRLSVLGHFIAELPTQRANLTPAVPGIRFPSPSYKLNQGFGVTWAGGVVAGKDSTFDFNVRSFQQSKPSAQTVYTKSFLPISQASQIVAPRTDFAERFAFGYMDSVAVKSPDSEQQFLQAKRSSLSGAGQLNGSVADRDRGTRYSKVEAVYEAGSAKKGFGLLGQARLQGLQREEEGMEGRLALTGSLGLPSIRLAPGLSTIARIDSATFAGETLFGWGRAMAGLSYTPAKWIRLSAAGYGSGEFGTPQFAIDPLHAKNGILMRADIAIGGLQLSYLTKNDGRRGVYDREIAINQVIGCFEAFYILRDYPRDRRIGLTIRIQPLIDIFKRRGLDRTGNNRPVPPATGGAGGPVTP